MTPTPRRLDPRLVRQAKGWIKRLAVQRGLLVRRLPRGRQGDAFLDQAALLNGSDVRTIFDVGAYVGETTMTYRRLFPGATIHCFEPTPNSFAELTETLAHDPHVQLNQLAVGAADVPVELHINRSAATSSTLAPAANVGDFLSTEHLEEVGSHVAASVTIDGYCARHGIEHVDILKLDIQGAELAALQGASAMLSRAAISIVFTELLIAPIYEGQADVGELLSFAKRYGYGIYGLYDFAYGNDSRLMQMDALLLGPKGAKR